MEGETGGRTFDELKDACPGRIEGMRIKMAAERLIVGFHQDQEGNWVAELECGHNQHVRHDPPWQERSWVLTSEGRRTRLGTRLTCRLCRAEETGSGA
jgi:hypothetical protein